jgi:hypothetical protein
MQYWGAIVILRCPQILCHPDLIADLYGFINIPFNISHRTGDGLSAPGNKYARDGEKRATDNHEQR